MMNQLGTIKTEIKSELEDIPQYDGACGFNDSSSELEDIPQLDGAYDSSLPNQLSTVHQLDIYLPPMMKTNAVIGVDLPFYGLGMNSPHIISTIWYAAVDESKG